MAVAAVKSLIEVNQSLDAVMAWLEEAQALDRVTRGRRIDDGFLVRPQTVHIDAEDLLCLGAFIDLGAGFVLGVCRKTSRASGRRPESCRGRGGS